MNYKELSYAFKNIISWYKKKTKVLNIKSRPYNTGFVFFDLISRLINDNKKVLYVFSMGSDEIKSKSHDELYMKSIQKIMPGDIENGIDYNKLRPFLSLDRCTQSTNECVDCEVAGGCAWCQGENYDAADTYTFFQRATAICKMHKARVRANNYYWNKLYRKLEKEGQRKEDLPVNTHSNINC